MGTASVRVLYWFRTDLRLHSSPALHAALALRPDVIFPVGVLLSGFDLHISRFCGLKVWTWDPEYVFAHRVGVNRYVNQQPCRYTVTFRNIHRFRFLLESMQNLSESLTALNPTTKLLVVRGAPQTVLPILFQEWGISHLVYEVDRAGYAAVRDRQVSDLAFQAGVKVITVVGNTLYDPEKVVELNGGKATLSLSSWHAVITLTECIKRPHIILIHRPSKIVQNQLAHCQLQNPFLLQEKPHSQDHTPNWEFPLAQT
jgi:cryptochrome